MSPDLLEGLSAAQTEAVTTPDTPLAIVAGPGAGKTGTLTRRVAYRAFEGLDDPARTLVLTFSRRAARQLRTRLSGLGLPTGAREGGVLTGTFHGIAWGELSRFLAERRQPSVTVLGRPARLIATSIRSALGRDPRPGEPAAIAAQWGRLRASSVVPYGPVWSAYELAKRSRRVVDLDDLVEQATALLRDDRQAAEAWRWRYRHIYVDEYQDLNAAHLQLLHAWVGDRREVCVVGDPGQAIYGFNGSVPDLFDRLEQDWPGISTIRLTDNFRSSPEIASLASSVGMAGISRCPPGPIPSVTAHRDDEAEARAVAAAIAACRVPGSSRRTTAVLARTNARLRQVAACLDTAGVPWHMRDPRPLADHPALGTAPLDAPAAALDVDAGGPALRAALAEYRESAPLATVRMFASWLDATGATAEDGEPSGVELATFHRAKGLEWQAVWVIGVGDVDQTAEERRLVYVALTRATEDLAVSWSGAGTELTDALADARARLAARPPPAEQRRRLHQLVEMLS